METRGLFAPEAVDDARDAYETVEPAARVVVSETAKAMGLDRESYDERVTPAVVETARDALFASLLRIEVGRRDEFDEWRASFDGDVTVVGSKSADRVVWHAAPFAGEAVAATFRKRTDAAAGTLRRRAFGRIYRDRLRDDRTDGSDPETKSDPETESGPESDGEPRTDGLAPTVEPEER